MQHYHNEKNIQSVRHSMSVLTEHLCTVLAHWYERLAHCSFSPKTPTSNCAYISSLVSSILFLSFASKTASHVRASSTRFCWPSLLLLQWTCDSRQLFLHLSLHFDRTLGYIHTQWTWRKAWYYPKNFHLWGYSTRCTPHMTGMWTALVAETVPSCCDWRLQFRED